MLVDDGKPVLPKADVKEYPDYYAADRAAVDALWKGNASPEQQRRAARYIVEIVAGVHDIPARGTDSDTYIAIGKAIVGKHILWLAQAAPKAPGSPEQGDNPSEEGRR